MFADILTAQGAFSLKKYHQFILLFILSLPANAAELFHIDIDRVSNIALDKVLKKHQQLSQNDLTLYDINYKFSDHKNFNSRQLLEITFTTESKAYKKSYASHAYKVAVTQGGQVLSVVESKLYSSHKRMSRKDKVNYTRKCVQINNLRESFTLGLSGAEVCKYGKGKGKCAKHLLEQKKVPVTCFEKTMGECFEKKAWMTGNALLGVAYDREVVNTSKNLVSNQYCGEIKKREEDYFLGQ